MKIEDIEIVRKLKGKLDYLIVLLAFTGGDPVRMTLNSVKDVPKEVVRAALPAIDEAVKAEIEKIKKELETLGVEVG